MRLFYILFLLVSQILVSQIWSETLEDAKNLAKQKNKFILIDFTASWCVPCNKMKTEYWYNSKYQKTLDKFIVVPVDIDFQKNITGFYSVNSIPNVKLIDYTGKLIYEFLGYETAIKSNAEIEGFPGNTEDLYQNIEFKDKKNPTDEELLMLATSYQVLIQKSNGHAKSVFEKLSNSNFTQCIKKTKEQNFKETSELGILFNNVLLKRNNKVIKKLDLKNISSENKSFAHYILALAFFQEMKKDEGIKQIDEINLINDKQWKAAAEDLKKKYNE